MTDRYSKAIEQLGSEALDVRIGGIYALERIARDSPRDHPTIIEVLAAFIREHSHEQWPPAKDDAQPPARTTRPDVQAAATVIGRRNIRHDSQPINLRAADLTSANLTGANLTRAVLDGAKLTDANLTSADLTGAKLARANLTRVVLDGAKLTHAHLTGADLTGADLTVAYLTGAHLTGVNFTGAHLRAHFTGADLTGAFWPPDEAVPAGWQRDTDSGRLKRADTDSGGAPTDPAPAT